jgi:hypothetical protein
LACNIFGENETFWDTKTSVSMGRISVSFQKIDARKIRLFLANETNETLQRGIAPCLIHWSFVDIAAIVDDFNENSALLCIKIENDSDLAGADAIISSPRAGKTFYINRNRFAEKFSHGFPDGNRYELIGEMVLRKELFRLAR